MSNVYSDRQGYLLFSAASGTGSALDARMVKNYGLIQHSTYGASAILTVQASVDMTGWLDVVTYTATTTTATAQWSGYYPYLRANVNAVYSGGGATGTPNLYFAGGIH